MKVKVSDSLDNVPNENVVTQLVTDQPTDRQTDQLLELLELLFATKNDEPGEGREVWNHFTRLPCWLDLFVYT